MIFISLGSQKFQFNRVLEEMDRLINEGYIKCNVFAQIGYSTYIPRYYEYSKFLDKSEYLAKIEDSSIVVTHGGTGSIINSVKKEKKVIGIPRLEKYGEHVDNHQLDIITQFAEAELIYAIKEIDELLTALKKVKSINFRKYQSNTENVIKILEDYLIGIH